MRNALVAAPGATLVLIAGVAVGWPPILWSLRVVGPVIVRGIADMCRRARGAGAAGGPSA